MRSSASLTGTLLITAIACFLGKGNLSAQVNTPPDTTYIYTLDSLEYELDEVVITGTRTKKKIIDIPYPVSRINNLSFRYDRKIGVDDVLSDVPGMFMQSRYGNHDVRISIRGFGSKSNSGIRGVRILLDDIPESEPDGQTRIEAIDFNSIGSIEVVKGNSSSLYTNAPGGVVNFINEIDFPGSFVMQFNQFGSFGLSRNGIKAGVKTNNYRLLTTYSYQNYDGYREHNSEYWHILNLVLETTPTEYSSLKILGYFVDGEIKLPGSLTREEFDEDPWQADQRSVDRDQKRISTKGRLGIRFNTRFGKSLNNEIEITSYGTIKYFERTNREYRIINRYGLGLTARYVNTSKIGSRINELSFGGDLLFQPARTEYYKNLGGQKDDILLQLLAEKISNTGFYISENFEILHDRMFFLLTGRYDRVVYDVENEIAQFLTGYRVFNAFTPKMALNYKFTPFIAAYTSIGLSFDSPAKNELDSFDPGTLYNDELSAEESLNFELGIKGNLMRPEENNFRSALFELTFFNLWIDNEIVPYEVYGEVYFRNAASTTRTGIEFGATTELIRDLDLSFTYTFSNFRYQTYTAATIEIDSTGNVTEDEKDFSGNIVPSIPVHNVYTSLAYSYPFHRHISGFIKMSYRGISGLWVDDANSSKTEAYNLINSVIGLDMRFGGLNILLSGGLNNMLDEIYVGFTNTNSATGRFYEAGEPRNWFLTVNLGYVF
jgi:iron complex outermembrane receptor protein